MELLSNLFWVVVAVGLWCVWLAQPRNPRSLSMRFGIGGQIVALAVLTLILLPVISVSDDLQASYNPAEIERTCVRNDQHLLLPSAPPPAPAAIAVVMMCLLHTPGASAFLRSATPPCRKQAVNVRAFASRPPPIA